MGWMAAIPAIASVGASLLGSKGSKSGGGETINAEQLMPEWQKALGKDLGSFVSKYLNTYTPGANYSGDFTAGMTDQELAGINRLNSILSAPTTGGLFASAKNQIADTLAGKFINPATSPYIQAMTELGKQGLQDQLDSARASSGARGTYFTKSAIQGENKLRENTLNNLNAIIGNFVQNERGNILNAANTAQGFDQYENLTAPLATVAASQQYGGLQRIIDQAGLESQYNDFLRKQNELSNVASTGAQLYNSGGQYGVKSVTAPTTTQPSSLSNILGVVSKLNLGAIGNSGGLWDTISAVLKG